MKVAACPLCQLCEAVVLYQNDLLRVIQVDMPDYPGFLRVIWSAHCAEMTDLAPADQHYLMRVVLAVESVVRQHCRPDKINLASLGNQVPHVHWHIIPRWRDDPHFPDSIWALPKRQVKVTRPFTSLSTWRQSLSNAIAAIDLAP